jgi:hypothetical protein
MQRGRRHDRYNRVGRGRLTVAVAAGVWRASTVAAVDGDIVAAWITLVGGPPDAKLGRGGRLDILLTGIDPERQLPFEVIVEVKNTAWERIALHHVRPNVNRYRLQLWSYIESQRLPERDRRLEPAPERIDSDQLAWVQGFLLYPTRPDSAREELLSAVLDLHGVSVEYADEIGPK